MSKHNEQMNEIGRLTLLLIHDMDEWPQCMECGLEIVKDACCAEVALRATAFVFQAMASGGASRENPDPYDVQISRSFVNASKRILEITKEPVFQKIAMTSDGTIN